MFTSGIVSTKEGRKIALFFSGRKHAGENLADVLAERAESVGRADPDVRRPVAELAGRIGDDRGPLSGARPAAVRRGGGPFSRGVPARAGIVGGGLSQRRHRARAEAVALGATALPSSRERPDDGGTSRLACPAVGGAAGGAELVVGRGDFVPAEALGAADAFLARARRAAGQQRVRTRVEACDPAPQERPVLQDLPRRARGRLVYEPDPHLRNCAERIRSTT